MLFSVVIPVFNRDPTPALKSVEAQSLPDWECIVVDDGSANGVEIEAAVEAMSDSRFRYVRRDNGGGGAARNTGINEAAGMYIAFLDSDDFWLPEKLERDAELVSPDSVLFSPVVMVRGGKPCDIRPTSPPSLPISEYLVLKQGWTPTSTMVVPATVKSRYSEYARFGQDTDFALKLADEGLRFVMHPEPLCLMDDTENSNRVSRSPDWPRACVWLLNVEELMTPRSVLAYRGWHIARMAAQAGNYRAALTFWWRAFVSGAFSPQLAAKSLGQILIPRRFYKRFQAVGSGRLGTE